MRLVLATRAKHDPNLLSLSRMRYFGACPYGVASRSCWATQGSEGERVTPTWITRRDFSSTMKNAKSGRKKRSVTCKKSHAQTCAAWLREKVAHFCPRGGFVRTPRMYFWMVRLQTRMPNFKNSPRILSAPQSRLSFAICLIKAIVSAATFGLWVEAFDLRFQYRWKSSRCQRSRVSGATMSRACCQVRTSLASRTRSVRSVLVQAGRFTWRLRMISCCLKSAFSARSSDLLRPRSVRVASGKEVYWLLGTSVQKRDFFELSPPCTGYLGYPFHKNALLMTCAGYL